MFINYAHRGASAYAPENTMRAFRLALTLGANGIETDIRRTRDGVPVLFHDKDLLRLTGRDGAVEATDFRRLSALRIPAPDGADADGIPKLTDLLAFAQETDLFLALELKGDGLETDVLAEIAAFGVKDRCIVTSFEAEHLRRIKALDKTQAVGLLTREVNADVLLGLQQIGAEQICPVADVLSPALVRSLHRRGFSVRAWGVRDEETMKAAYLCGVDGMTVNFPDKLRALLQNADRE